MNISKSGFTIVELLIVIVVIGILAAITIVAYNGIQDKARDNTSRVDLANLAKQFEMHYAQNDAYPSTAAQLLGLDVSINKQSYLTDTTTPFNLVPCVTSDAQKYTIASVSSSGKRFYVTSSSGVAEYTGATAWTGVNNYTQMCSTTLSGSAVISSGAGYGSGWRSWTNG